MFAVYKLNMTNVFKHKKACALTWFSGKTVSKWKMWFDGTAFRRQEQPAVMSKSKGLIINIIYYSVDVSKISHENTLVAVPGSEISGFSVSLFSTVGGDLRKVRGNRIQKSAEDNQYLPNKPDGSLYFRECTQ